MPSTVPLAGVPVAVLSNNDGGVVARSREVKQAGGAMGEPLFKCREKLRAIGARVLSSNYALYADVSRRVMEVLGAFSDDVEAYSIDEAFLLLPRPPSARARGSSPDFGFTFIPNEVSNIQVKP